MVLGQRSGRLATTGSTLVWSTLVWPALVAVAFLGVLVVIPAPSQAVWSGTTSSTSPIDAGELRGIHAPDGGVGQFVAHPVSGSCFVQWSALSGGGAVADRFELIREPSGVTIWESPDVGMGGWTEQPAIPVMSYRLRTRAATTWVSPPEEDKVTTCVDPGDFTVDAGENGTCAIQADRTMWCWGFGQWRTTGDDEYRTVSVPQLEDSASWEQVSVAFSHTCAIRTDRTLWCLGDNWTGQLGTGGSATTTFEQVGTGTDWNVVHAFRYSTCGLRGSGGQGELWCWGRNESGQLGNGTTNAAFTPERVGTDANWMSIRGGIRSACGTKTDYTLWCWGSNADGLVGDGTLTQRLSPVHVAPTDYWTSSLSIGDEHACAVQRDGTLWCWGTNWFGERGSAPSSPTSTPTQVGTDDDWALVAAGRYFTCATKIDRTLWCSGSNIDAKTGQGIDTGNTTSFTQVGADTDWTMLTVGSTHGCGIRSDEAKTNARLVCWGSNRAGESGTFNTSWASPQPVNAASWSRVEAGYRHTCGLRSDQALLCWGINHSGQLGMGTYNDGFITPTEPLPGTAWIDIGPGDFFSCGIQADGTAWCWGRNDSGQLGNGSIIDSTSPVQIGSDTDWALLNAGRSHTCAIRTSATLWCWGENGPGALGDGTTVDSAFPMQVGTDAWSAVDGGFHHTCGIQTNGTLWCWGSGDYGQLGDGLAADSTVPVQVGSDTDWATVGLGRDHSCAVKTTGTAWCWGRNSSGELGDGTTSHQPNPVQVGAASSWVRVNGGFGYSCGRHNDGTLSCWGRNGAGQFGNGTTGGISTTPTPYHFGTDDFTTATGGWHTCGITSGILSCWGANEMGQLGYNNVLLTPTEVAGGYVW